MTKPSTSFNKQLLDYWGFIKEMYQWRGSPWLFSSTGYREQRKFMQIEAEKKNVLVFRQWADLFQFSKFRNVKWTSLFLFGFCTKMIFANEWSNARNGIYTTKSRTSFNKKLLNYWIFPKGMYHWRGSLCLSSSDGHHEQGKFMRIESEKR